jgi:hypothetical protein
MGSDLRLLVSADAGACRAVSASTGPVCGHSVVKIRTGGPAMASVTWRRGAWELRYRDRHDRQRTERFPGPQQRRAPEEVRDRQAQVERDLRRGTYVPREEREASFAEYYQRWSAVRRVSVTRRYTDDIRARLHVLPYWGHWQLCDIRPSDIDDWVARLAEQMGPWSVRHCYQLLRARCAGP